MKIVNKLEEASIMKIYDYLEKNPEKNMKIGRASCRERV